MAEKMKVACILGDGFEDSEFQVPYDKLTAAGFDVTVIGPQKDETLEGKQGKVKVKPDLAIDGVRMDAYDLLLIPGGHSPDHLRADERFVELVRSFDEDGKWIAAVCHGPQLFITARIVKGRTLTAWSTVQADLEAAGANVQDEPVVIDRNWITSRKPDDLEQFSQAIIDRVRPGSRPEAGAHA